MRSILGAGHGERTDAELAGLRDQLYSVGLVVSGAYRTQRRQLLALEASERAAVEERAAILEFDAKLSRRSAEGVALASAIDSSGASVCERSSTAASRRKNRLTI